MLGLSDTELHLALGFLIKLGIGAGLAGLIGLERELRDHPAGIRTHILLILGVILYSEVSRGYGGEPSRVAAQIVTGVGFLCAGTIFRTGTDVKGLTTAASLWATSGIGMAVSLGGPYMAVAVCATLLSLLTLHVLAKLEKRYIKQGQTRTLKVVLEDAGSLTSVIQQVQAKQTVIITAIEVTRKEPETEASLQIRGADTTTATEVLNVPGVRIATLQ